MIDYYASNLKSWVFSISFLRGIITPFFPLEFSFTKERKLLKYKNIKKFEVLNLINIFKKIDKNKLKFKVKKISDSVFI